MTEKRPRLDVLLQNADILGVSLLQGSEEVDHRFISRWSPSHHQTFINTIDHFLKGFSQVGRQVREIAFVFRSIHVAILKEEFYVLVLVTKREASFSSVVSIGRSWLRDYLGLKPLETFSEKKPFAIPSPPPPTDLHVWGKFKEELEAILSKVLSSSQCEPLIERNCRVMGFGILAGVPENRFEELGVSVIRQIPNRSKQESLMADFEELLKRRKS